MNDNSSPDFDGGASGALSPTSRVFLPAQPVAVRPRPVTSSPPRKPGGTFSAFRHHNFRLFWSGACISNLGNWMQTVGQNWLVLTMTNSPFMLGLVNFVANLPMLLLSLVGGVLADRTSRRQVLLITQITMMALVFTMAVLTFFNIINIWLVLLLAFSIGIVQAFNSPAFQSIMLDLVGKDDLMNAIALNSVQFNLTRIIGPSIAGVLISAIGVAACFFTNTLSYLAVIGALVLVKLPKVEPKANHRSILQEIQESLGYLKQHRELAALLGLSAAFSIFALPYMTLMPVFVTRVFHSGPEGYGLLLTAVGVGALIGSLIVASASNRMERRAPFMLGGTAVVIVGLVGFGLSSVLWVSMAILAVCGGAMVISNATLNSIVQANSPDELRGRIISIMMLCSMGMMPVGNLISGILAELMGAPFTMVLNAFIFMLLVGLVNLFVPKLRQF